MLTRWPLLASAGGLLIAPALMAATTPALTPSPPSSVGQPAALSVGVPSTAVPGRLDRLVDTLPIVVQDLPDQPSRAAASSYARLRLRDPAAARSVLGDAWRGVQTRAGDRAAWDALGDAIIAPVPDQSAVSNVAIDAYGPQQRALLARLTFDGRNGDRVSNSALFMFTLGLVMDSAPPEPSLAPPWLLRRRALQLMDDGVAAFPGDRALALNDAYVVSVVPPPCYAGLGPARSGLERAQRWLRAHGEDRTARLLVASLLVRDVSRVADTAANAAHDGDPLGLADAIAVLQPLFTDPAAAALGSATLGDAYLVADSAVRVQSPSLARRYARQAWDAYRQALSSIADPGLLAGEALALDDLDEPQLALDAARLAARMRPDSAELELRLAEVLERTGDFPAMWQAASQALDVSLRDVDPPIVSTRLVQGRGGHVAGDRGYFGYSLGSDLPRTPVPFSTPPPGCGGGIFVIGPDPIAPEPDVGLGERTRSQALPDAILLTALRAATVIGKVSDAASLAARWSSALGAVFAVDTPRVAGQRNLVDGEVLPAVSIAAGRTPPTGPMVGEAARVAESTLEHEAAAADRPDLFLRAARLCGSDRQCFAEALHRAGHEREAADAFARAIDELRSIHSDVAPVLILEEGFAELRAGDVESARQQFVTGEVAARKTSDATYGMAALLLGETKLVQGDPAGSISDFSIALDAVQQLLQSTALPSEFDRPLARLLASSAFNDRGVARLWQAQGLAETPPDCRHQACAGALGDFESALELDPLNPYYLMNRGWTNQLVGAEAEARRDLDAAIAGNPREYPVANDLGVLYLKRGDRARGRQLLEQALAARPDYDLAAWNLGIVSMTDGPIGVAAAQGSLARAIRENPALRDAPLRLRTDERFYQAFESPASLTGRSALADGYSSQAILSGAVGVVAGLLDTHVGGELKSWLSEVLPRLPSPDRLLAGSLAALRRRRDQHAPARSARRVWRRIRSWAPTLAILFAITTWTAWRSAGDVVVATMGLALFAAATALAAHEAGHRVAARLLGTRIVARPCTNGIVYSIALAPWGAGGPFMGHQLAPGRTMKTGRWALLAGPAANLVVMVAALGLGLIAPLPVLLLVAQAQLAAAAFSLLPFRPLDGGALAERRQFPFSILPMALGLIVIGLGLLLRTGRL